LTDGGAAGGAEEGTEEGAEEETLDLETKSTSDGGEEEAPKMLEGLALTPQKEDLAGTGSITSTVSDSGEPNDSGIISMDGTGGGGGGGAGGSGTDSISEAATVSTVSIVMSSETETAIVEGNASDDTSL